MAQVVDMTSDCGQGQDMKDCCETLAVGGGDEDESPAPETTIIEPPQKEDEYEYAYAPESFWLSKDAELDWLDRNAYLDRKDSGKAGKPARYSGGVNIKSKAALIGGLPNYKPQSQKQNCGHRKHGHGVSVRLFPNKRSEPVGPKPSLSMTEPGSPKVSCMGRVKSRSRSRKERRIQNKADQPQPSSARNRSGSGSGSGSGVHVKHRKSGFGFGLGLGFWRSIFRSKGPPTRINNDHHSPISASSSTTSSSNNKRPLPSDSHPNTGSLGGMKRFASGRKSDAWAAHVEVDGAKSEPLDLPAAGPIWRCREVGPPLDVDLDVQRDWRTLGPISV